MWRKKNTIHTSHSTLNTSSNPCGRRKPWCRENEIYRSHSAVHTSSNHYQKLDILRFRSRNFTSLPLLKMIMCSFFPSSNKLHQLVLCCLCSAFSRYVCSITVFPSVWGPVDWSNLTSDTVTCAFDTVALTTDFFTFFRRVRRETNFRTWRVNYFAWESVHVP